MERVSYISIAVFCSVLLGMGVAQAHVPYLETDDYTDDDPFEIPRTIRQSLAAYAWLEFDEAGTEDVDVYTFDVKWSWETNVFIETLVPVCAGYEDFLPAFAIVGPGLPEPSAALPFDIPQGQGAIVVENLEPGEERPQFFEPFGDKDYYQGPNFEQVMPTGTYTVYVWDPYGLGGDYVIVFGDKEIWGISDIIRAFVETPKIRRGEELHIDCE
ncbi:MAG: hypothetical protein QNJ97_22410 [Myxococcota bacterium]|nr:hypothetical protein [Myxococcota bacterium]